MVEAILTGNEAFECPQEEILALSQSLAQTLLPQLVEKINWANGKASIVYKNPFLSEELLSDFDQAVTILLTAGKKGNMPEEMLLSRYYRLVNRSQPKEDGTQNPKGRFQQNYLDYFSNTADAFTFLCLQCGVDAVTAVDKDQHPFTLFSTGEGWYAADPEREIAG